MDYTSPLFDYDHFWNDLYLSNPELAVMADRVYRRFKQPWRAVAMEYRLFDLIPALHYCRIATAQVARQDGDWVLSVVRNEQDRLDAFLKGLKAITLNEPEEIVIGKICTLLETYHK